MARRKNSPLHWIYFANLLTGNFIPENDSEWVDIVEKELRHILEPKLLELSLRGNSHGVTRSTVSGSISSITPPLPPLSGGDNLSPTLTPKSSGKFKG